MASLLAGLLVVVAGAAPGVYFLLLILCVYLWMLIGGLWFVRGLAYSLCRFRYYGKNATSIPKQRRKWLVCPLAFVLALALVLVGAPLRATFWLSRPSMDQLAAQVMSSSSKLAGPTRVGLYRAVDCQPVAGGMEFLVSGAGYMDRYGFACFPRGAPRNIGNHFYERFSGNWYICREDF